MKWAMACQIEREHGDKAVDSIIDIIVSIDDAPWNYEFVFRVDVDVDVYLLVKKKN